MWQCPEENQKIDIEYCNFPWISKQNGAILLIKSRMRGLMVTKLSNNGVLGVLDIS